MIGLARRAAFRALCSVGRGERDAPTALADARRDLTDRRDLALANELVSGVLRWQAALDAGLAPLCTTAFDRLDLAVQTALRLGAYQLIYLTRVPASAAVHDAVSLIRESGPARAAGFVNAVLRHVDPSAFRARWPVRPEGGAPHDIDARAALDYLSTTLSHPRWLVDRWLLRFGFEDAERWALFDNTTPSLTLRPVPWRLTRDELAARLADSGVTTHPARWAPQALTVTAGHPLQSPLAANGVFVAQEEVSQLVAQLAADLCPTSILDVCAAPGGKTTYMRGAAFDARIVACDRRGRRVALLRETLARQDTPRVHVVQADASRSLPFQPSFSLVLADVPCSGLGTIRREPDIRWRRHEQDLPGLAATQRLIAREAARCVAPGGCLIYATCSSEPEENEHVVDAFLEEHPRFRRMAAAAHPWTQGSLASLLDHRGDLRTLPHRHALEAFYAAVLVDQG